MNKFIIEGMKCESCVAKIGSALQNAGHDNAITTLKPAQVEFPANSAITSEELQKIITTAGDYRVSSDALAHHTAQHESLEDERLTPLFVILSFIIGGVVVRALIADNFSFISLMDNFMGGFFVVFSLFKLLNLSGFADAFATYDLLASRSRAYALAYPFVELLLGIAFFFGFEPMLTNTATLILMTVGSVGVFKALRSKRKIQCACLGTSLKLPMTKVTLVEDVTMGLMAIVMIIHQVLV